MKRTIKDALPIVATAYGEKFGIRVVIEGKQAKTDGTTIYLPAADIKSQADKNVLWGYLAHEAAHIRYTNFYIVRMAYQPIMHSLLNIVEDVRIEQLLGKTYPGTLQTINAVINHLVDTNEIRFPKEPTPISLLLMHCLLTLRLTLLKQKALIPVQQKVAEAMQHTFPRQFNQSLLILFKRVTELKSTEEALEWVNAVLELIKDLPSEINQDSNTASDTENQQGDNQQHGNNPSQSPQSHNNNENDKNSDTDTHKDNNQTQANSSVATQSHRVFDKPALTELSQSILQAKPDEVVKDIFDIAAKSIGRIAKKSDKLDFVDIGQVEPASVNLSLTALHQYQLALKSSVLLRARLRNTLLAMQQTKPAPKQQGRKVLPKRLASSQAGETKLFRQSINQKAPNADIHLLVDASSSMARNTVIQNQSVTYGEIANQSALGLALALEGIEGISLAVSYFSKASNTVAIRTVLRPKQRVKSHYGKFLQYPNGNTPMKEAIWFAVHDVLKLKGERKIIIVITDGRPNDPDSTQSVINLCKQNQIELVGIGIQEPCVKTLFERHIVIENVSELKSKLFDCMQQVLMH